MADLSICEDDVPARDMPAAAVPSAASLRRPAVSWSLLLPWVVPVLLYALWWKAAHAGWMSAQILPTPELVARTAYDMGSDNLLSNLLVSLERLAIGFAWGAALGTLLGVLMGGSAIGEAVVAPSLYAFAQVPPLALIPLLMVVVGIGESLKILLIAKAVVIPVAIQTELGVRNVSARRREVSRVLHLSRWQRLRVLVVPSALPAWLTGVRQALAQGWLTLIAVELLASSEGIGYLMVDGRQMFELDVVFVCIAVIGVTGFVLDQGVQRFEALVVRWPHEAGGVPDGGRLRGWRRAAYGAALPLLLFGAWIVTTHYAWVDPRILPTPSQVLGCAWDDARSGALPVPLAHTLERAAQGLVVGALTGIAAGLLLGAVRGVRRVFGPTLTGLRQIAIFAWIPLLTAWAGIDDPAKIIFVALAAFFPVVFATQRAVEALPVKLIEVAHTLRLGLGQRLRWLVIPVILPGVVAGLRLALVYAWLGAIGAEYFMPSGAGLGTFMMDAQQLFRMDRLLGAAVVVAGLGSLLGWTGNRLEAHATRWQRAH